LAAAALVVLVGALAVGTELFRDGTDGSDAAPQAVPTNATEQPSASPTGVTPDDTGQLPVTAPFANQECSGQFLVILASSGSPSEYVSTLEAALAVVPDAKYLRTDQSCSTFNQEVDGHPIYAAYAGPFDDVASACAARQATGVPASYVRQLGTDRSGREFCACLRDAADLPRLGIANAYEPSYSEELLVVEIQPMLYQAGAVGGHFQEMTRSMVREFQSANGLTVDGWVGPQTWAALQGAACP
jgi:peptidoglycan hydrolase-like protein with peptidoglycan-binding domain